MESYVQRGLSRWFTCLFASLLFISFPSAAANFSFIEFNIAFILGLSLPVLVITSLMKPLISVKLRYPAISTASLFGMLFCLVYLQNESTQLLLSFATVYISVVYLWPLAGSLFHVSTRTLFTTRASFVVAIAYLSAIWLMPQIDAYFLWLIFGVTILLLSGLRMANLLHGASVITLRVIVRWLVVLTFVVGMYLWLHARIVTTAFVLIVVSGYLITLLTGSWQLVQSVLEKLSAKYRQNMVSKEDVYNYTHDHATNLPCHQFALNQLDSAIKDSDNRRYAAIVFRPINFQQVNTVLGHHNSDILLLQFAYSIAQHLAPNHKLLNFDEQKPTKLARLQSLHFLVVVDLTDNHHPAQDVITALCKEISIAVPEALSFKSFSLNFELAFGAAIVGEHGQSASEVIAHAEDALLVAERDEQLVHFFDHNTIFYTERHLRQMEQLKQDIIDDRLNWYLQPQVNLQQKNIVGFELLVGWQNNEAKQQTLSEFIKLAEHSGEVYFLTKQMVKRAFKVLFTLHKMGIYQPVSINLSSTDLLEPELVDYIEKQSQNYSIPTKFLVAEMTEAVMLSACQRAKSLIDQLRVLDVSIAIDDFSGSYEALRYMRKMSINQVKINCGQISVSQEAQAEKAIVNALVSLAKTMKLPLVGTSVDNKEVADAFAQIGGEVGQGRLIKHDLAIDDITDWVNFWLKEYPHLRETDSE